MLAIGVVAAVVPQHAGATTPATLTYANSGSGTVNLNPTNPDANSGLTPTGGIPYSSGQVVDLDIAANSVFSAASLGVSGDKLAIEQCTDVDGLPDDLPTVNTSCDSNTVQTTEAVNDDGSLDVDVTVYSTPDIGGIGDQASAIKCNASNPCVFLITTNQVTPQVDTPPHLFSAPFYVVPSSNDDGADPGDGSAPPAVTAPSPTASTVMVSSPTAVADGVSSSTITVTLEGTGGAQVTNSKSLTLSQGSGHSTVMVGTSVTNIATTDATTGQATFTVTDQTAEDVTYTVTDTTDSNLVLQPSVPATVDFSAPVATGSLSDLSPSQTPVPSGQSSTLTLVLKDQAGNPMANQTVTLEQGSGSSIIMVGSTQTKTTTTGTNGRATFTVTDADSEQVTYTVSVGGNTVTGLSTPVTFGMLTVSATASTLVVDAAVHSVVGTDVSSNAATVTVTLQSSGDSPVDGKTVSLALDVAGTSTAASATITSSSPVTGQNGNSPGQAVFTVTDATAEIVAFVPTDVTDSSLVITPTPDPTVTFAEPAVSATDSTVVLQSSTPIRADGTQNNEITVTVNDQFGKPVAGQTIGLSASAGTSSTINASPIQGGDSTSATVTDSQGQVQFDILDEVAESVTYTATDTTATPNVVLAQTVTGSFVAGPPDAATSSVAASPTQVPADGSTTSTVTVTLRDYYSNPIPDKEICLAADAGSSVIAPAETGGDCPTGQGYAPTDDKGQATFTVTDTKNEVVTYTATDVGDDNFLLTGQGVAVTFGTAPAVVPSTADSDVTVSAASVPADGTSTVNVTVELLDVNGNPVSGKTVALNPETGSSSVTTVNGTSGQDGLATFTVTDKSVESVKYTATDMTDSTLVGQPVEISFTTPTATSGTTTASPTSTATTTPSSTSSAGGAASDAASTAAGNSGTTSTNSTPALAFTGASPMLPWLFGVGLLLLVMGSLGRRRMSRGTDA